jgi:NADH:ubiquinone oxidoreductase subunit C
MIASESIQHELLKKFPSLVGHVRVQRQRRIQVDVEYKDFRKVFDSAVKEMDFTILCAITGLDEGARFGLVYHLANEKGIMINMKTDTPKEAPVIATVTELFPAAEIYERELVDLLGIQVDGLLEGNRYPLSDNWPKGQYPLRKDWKAKDTARKEP